MTESAMRLEEIRRKTNPFNFSSISISLTALVIVVWCWHSTDMSVPALMDGWGNMYRYIAGNPEIKDSGFFPPTIAGPTVTKYLISMLETVQMAVLALILSVLIAFPLSLLASRNTLNIIIPGDQGYSRLIKNSLYTLVRFFANLCRSWPHARHSRPGGTYFRRAHQAFLRRD